MSTNIMTAICKDIITSEKFVFENQSIIFQDEQCQVMNITRSIKQNCILNSFLSNTILFIKTKSSDINIGSYPHSSPSQEVFIQASQVDRVNQKQLEITYQRLSPSEFQNLQSSSSQKNIKKQSKCSKGNFQEQEIIEELYESCNESTITKKNSKKQKIDNLIMQKQFTDDFIFEDEDIYNQVKSINSQSTTSTVTTGTQNQVNNIQSLPKQTSAMSTSDTLSKNDDQYELSYPHQFTTQQQQINLNSSRSKERTISSAVKIVTEWRDLYLKYKEKLVFRDLQQIAEEIGLSKKVLDYYFLELRTAEFFGFDFENNMEQKFGKIRKFNHSNKQNYMRNNNSKKIPIQSNFSFRLSQNNKSNCNNQSVVYKPLLISSIPNFYNSDCFTSTQLQPQIASIIPEQQYNLDYILE